jgi:hypothetical protein
LSLDCGDKDQIRRLELSRSVWARAAAGSAKVRLQRYRRLMSKPLGGRRETERDRKERSSARATGFVK